MRIIVRKSPAIQESSLGFWRDVSNFFEFFRTISPGFGLKVNMVFTELNDDSEPATQIWKIKSAN